MFSIVIPGYNSSLYIKESINNVLKQSYKKFEFIIIDDGSTDNSIDIIKSYKDKRIKLISNCHNYIESLNRGIQASKGEYIARMDADDIMLPQRLKIQYDFLKQNPNIFICGSWAESFGKETKIVQTHVEHESIIGSMLLYNPIINPSTMMRRIVFNNNLGMLYKEGYPRAEDYKLWTDFASKGFHFANIPKVLLKYRLSDTQITSNKKIEMANSTFKIQKEYARTIIFKIIEKEEKLTHFINELIKLTNDDIISFNQTLKIILNLSFKEL